MQGKSITIVLAEDDDGHAALIEKNLIRGGLSGKVYRVRDGIEALSLLRGEGSFAQLALHAPFLVILDVNMPRLDGLETLRQLKLDPRLSAIPVIVLTTSDDPREIEQCYREGCNVYISKPVAYDSFSETIRRLGLLLEMMQLPDSIQQRTKGVAV